MDHRVIGPPAPLSCAATASSMRRSGLSEGLTTRHTENRLDVMSPTAFTGNVRVNWIVAWGKSVS